MAAESKSGLVGAPRRSWSVEERRRIVGEALAPGASVAEVARRHGLNANLIFKWIRRSREGWLDRRRGPRRDRRGVTPLVDDAAAAFVPVQIFEARSDALALPAPSLPETAASTQTAPREDRKNGRRGAMEISLPNGARISLGADVDARALRRVLSALGEL